MRRERAGLTARPSFLCEFCAGIGGGYGHAGQSERLTLASLRCIHSVHRAQSDGRICRAANNARCRDVWVSILRMGCIGAQKFMRV